MNVILGVNIFFHIVVESIENHAQRKNSDKYNLSVLLFLGCSLEEENAWESNESEPTTNYEERKILVWHEFPLEEPLGEDSCENDWTSSH